MAEPESPDQEPAGGGVTPVISAEKGRRSFAKLRRELSDDELSSPAVQRLLIDDIERLEREVAELKELRDRFQEADLRCAVLEERSKKSTAHDVMYGVCLTVGAAALGYAPAVWAQQPSGWLSIVFGGILIVGAVWSRAVKK